MFLRIPKFHIVPRRFARYSCTMQIFSNYSTRFQDQGMQAVRVLENLGKTLSQQLVLGNKSSDIFERDTGDLGTS